MKPGIIDNKVKISFGLSSGKNRKKIKYIAEIKINKEKYILAVIIIDMVFKSRS
jgi:hypothetical protein